MGMYVQNVPCKFQTGTVTTSATVKLDVQGFPFPLTVTVIPSGGGSVLVEYSTTPNAAGAASPTWISWPSGTVTATTNDYLKSPVSALRFTATTASATYEVSA